ncbi:MAG: cupin domain-containing protein [Lentimicrobium sp.]|nr:cupin domain-containing protein [Lentimicrobium sp.]
MDSQTKNEMVTPEQLIEQLHLEPHPEGGYFKETYRSKEKMVCANNNQRNLSTTIFYLLEDTQKSHFHRLSSDEQWFFHMGQTLEIVLIEGGKARSILLGTNFQNGETLQALIPANTWFSAKINESTGYALASCTVSPGFDFHDFELGNRELLIQEFPQLKERIIEFTRQK